MGRRSRIGGGRRIGLAAKADDLSSISDTHMVEGES